jgi:lipoyl(octanoyl) transferase
VPYTESLALQTALHDKRAAGEIDDTLLQLEHPHVYTIGRRGSPAEILLDEPALRARGVEVHEADRGGMVTYHGPGQLVGYPILHLGPAADLVRYLRDLEEALIRTLASYGIEAGRVAGSAGVWIGREKIAAVGVRVTRGVTKHGYALNVSSDLSYFAGIVPCGISDKGVTSMQRLGVSPPVEEVAARVAEELPAVLGVRT